MAKSDGADYFKRTSLFWLVSLTLAIGHFTVIVFAPEKFPFEYLGPYGTFCRYLLDNYAGVLSKVWWVALAIHFLEAFYALKVCSSKGITDTTTRCMWFVQTFMVGYFSLGLLINYDPERPKRH